MSKLSDGQVNLIGLGIAAVLVGGYLFVANAKPRPRYSEPAPAKVESTFMDAYRRVTSPEARAAEASEDAAREARQTRWAVEDAERSRKSDEAAREARYRYGYY
jgi:hypothetical protein